MTHPEQQPTASRREHVAALVVLLLATLICFHKLALHPTEVLVGPQKRGHNDLIDQFIPAREYAAKTLHEFGQFPFWNPYICLGVPYTGNPQSALFYPPNWLAFVWAPARSLSWILVAHLLFAGLGVYFLARRLGLGWAGAVFGGAAFLAAPFLVAQSAEGHYPQICAVAWVPWAFLAYERLRSGCRGAVTALAVCLALSFFSGHAQETYYLVLLLSGCLLFDAWSLHRLRGAAEGLRLLLAWGKVGLFTAGLVAIDLIPILLYSRQTVRPTLRRVERNFGGEGLTFESLRELLDPFALTRPELSQPGETPFWEKLCYFGVVPLALAAAAVLLARRRPATRRMAILWLVTMLFAFGSRTPLWSGLAEVVPGLAWFRLPSRALFFTSFATAVLAAAGLDEVLRRIARADLTRDTSPRSRFGLLSPMPSLARCTSRRARWAGAPVIALALIALIAELSWFARQVTDTATIVPLAKRDPALLNALTLADAGLPRVLAMQDIVSDRDAFRHNVHKLQGYEPAGPAKYLLIAAQWPRNTREQVDPMGFLSTDVSKLQPGWLDLLGVRFAVQTRPVGDAAASVDGWVLVHSGQVVESVHRRGGRRGRVKYTYDLLRNESALPPAFVVGQARELKGLRAFTGALADLDFRREVVLGRDVLPEGPRSSFQPAAITRFTPNRIEVRADLDAPGYLVLSELSFPGWTAVAAGRALPVLEANGAFRAVPLPAGEHAVVFKFTPRGFVPGLLITAATMTVMVGGAARATRRRATWSSPLTSRRNRPERELQPAGVI